MNVVECCSFQHRMRFHSSLYFLLKKGIKPHPVLGCLSRFAFGQGFTRQQKLYSFISHMSKKVNIIKNSPSWDLIISNEQLTSRNRYTLRRVRRMTPYFLESSSARHYSIILAYPAKISQGIRRTVPELVVQVRPSLWKISPLRKHFR